ncbi:MAG: hypothetical protein ABIG89_01205 [Candidatus Woesearchaeota archaeon]
MVCGTKVQKKQLLAKAKKAFIEKDVSTIEQIMAGLGFNAVIVHMNFPDSMWYCEK